MCGRYSLTLDPAELKEAFPGVEVPDTETLARYNVAPSQSVPVIPNNHNNRVEFFHWGLIPSWAKDPQIGNRMINARAESLAEKPSFRTALKRRRCLVLANGFFEWRQEPGSKTKTPMFIRLKSGKPFGFAGLWDIWHSPDDQDVLSCTIVTTTPNSLVAKIHNRMPAIVRPEDYELWLDPDEQEPDRLAKVFKAYPASQMVAYPVSKLVNDPKNDVAECVAPLA